MTTNSSQQHKVDPNVAASPAHSAVGWVGLSELKGGLQHPKHIHPSLNPHLMVMNVMVAARFLGHFFLGIPMLVCLSSYFRAPDVESFFWCFLVYLLEFIQVPASISS